MIKIKRALISVSDKTGILEFARELNKLGIEIISTGGTFRLLSEHGIQATEISSYTGFPEILDGRVKTLHPKIHAGLLALRENQKHMDTLGQHGISPIDMVVVNLYPFREISQRPGSSFFEVIENIDIGGPSMLRSAAKNFVSVAAVSSPSRYGQIITELKKNQGGLGEDLLRSLASEVFDHTSSYDAAIYEYLKQCENKISNSHFPEKLILSFQKIQDLRYGENPQQKAAFYKENGKNSGLINLVQLQGKELSFNNILDLNSAVELIKEFKQPAAVIVKHNNPCGVSEDKNLNQAFLNAWNCDKLSAFGSIIALNRELDLKTADSIVKSGFLECIIAPGFKQGVIQVFKEKKNLRLIELKDLNKSDEPEFKRVCGGMLLQDKDNFVVDEKNLKVTTRKKPTKAQLKSLIFGFKVAKHVKSNAIVLTSATKTVGIGAGQMSRVDSVIIAKNKAGKRCKDCCLASDAFFPKPDSIAWAHKAGVKAIIQPGGSIADKEIIAACDKYKIAMVSASIRHFKH